jgi:hypothetical protein
MIFVFAHCHECFRMRVYPGTPDVTVTWPAALITDGVMLCFVAPLVLWLTSSWRPGSWRQR